MNFLHFMLDHMGRFDKGVETQFLRHFVWCIARLAAPVQNFVEQILFLQVDMLNGCSLQKKLYQY